LEQEGLPVHFLVGLFGSALMQARSPCLHDSPFAAFFLEKRNAPNLITVQSYARHYMRVAWTFIFGETSRCAQ
jgi:hypothetical protein